MKYSRELIQQLESRVDLPGFIKKYVPDLKKTSADTYTALCPFHKEDSGSFTVSELKGFYHCFGCGAHGGPISFLINFEDRPFLEVVKELANMVGMELPKEERPDKTSEQKQEAARYMKACDALQLAQTIYSKNLLNNAEAQTYLTQRGVTPKSIEEFGLGFAPDAWDTLTGHRSSSFTKDALLTAGLSKQRSENAKGTYDYFRDRLMFPIYDKKERIIGFGGRTIHNKTPKYLNSPDSIVFSKGSHLYGIKQANDTIHKAKRVFVVEGYMDVVMLSQNEIKNVVASLGTSITDEQIRSLFRLCSHITFCLDGDNAGKNAAWRAAENILPLLDENHKIDFMFMPDEIDPDDFVRAEGKEGFEQASTRARTLTDYLLDVFMRETNLNNGESLAKYLSAANAMANKIQNGVIKLSFQKRIAELAGISLDTMLQMLKEHQAKITKPNEQTSSESTLEASTVHPVEVVTVTRNGKAEISVAAKMLGIALIKDRGIATKLDPEYLSKFLSTSDREMLLPMLVYLKANPVAQEEALLATMAFNPHAKLINLLALSAKLVNSGYDATVEARHIVDGFRRMERVWQIVNAAKMQGEEGKG